MQINYDKNRYFSLFYDILHVYMDLNKTTITNIVTKHWQDNFDTRVFSKNKG